MKWYIITLPLTNVEKRIESAIEKGSSNARFSSKKVRLYVPMIKKFIDDSLIEEEQLYSGYAFLCLPQYMNERKFFDKFEDSMNSLTVLKRVSHEYLTKTKKIDTVVPVEIDESIIDETKEKCNYYSTNSISHIEFRIGERVHITKGVFVGFDGVVEYLDDLSDIISVRIFFLGKDVLIKADKLDLEK